jgi:hypothetical protein
VPGPDVLEREMGCTREDFLRWLPGATRQAPVRAEGEDLVLTVGAGEVRILLRERPPRRIALLALPVLGVRFTFAGLDEAARGDFLLHLDRHTQRGGG